MQWLSEVIYKMDFNGTNLRKMLLENTRDGNFSNFKFIISKYNVTLGELNNCKDDSGNNVLHLATQREHAEMVEYLLNMGMIHTVLNIFRKSPWDLALMLRNNDVIDRYVKHMGKKFCNHMYELDSLKKENSNLLLSLNREKELNRDNGRRVILLENSCHEASTLKKYNSELLAENSQLKASLKRSRDDVNELQESNKKLKLSVDTLMNNSRKK
jgi:ankyrin repeat protein